jgi:hypothetical protein
MRISHERDIRAYSISRALVLVCKFRGPAPSNVEELRVTSIDGPNYWASSGKDECHIIVIGREEDIRERGSVQTDEGIIYIKSESAPERYGHDLSRLVELLRTNGALEVELALTAMKVRKKKHPNTWKTFDRSRFENKAKPLSKVVRDVLGNELVTHGFEEREVSGLKIWAKSTDSHVHYIAFDRARFASEFRLFIAIDCIPLFGGGHIPGEHRAEFHDAADCWSFNSQSHLELRLKEAWTKLLDVAPAWYSNPMQYSWKEWRARGLDYISQRISR